MENRSFILHLVFKRFSSFYLDENFFFKKKHGAHDWDSVGGAGGGGYLYVFEPVVKTSYYTRTLIIIIKIVCIDMAIISNTGTLWMKGVWEVGNNCWLGFNFCFYSSVKTNQSKLFGSTSSNLMVFIWDWINYLKF